ncbi:MAG TPA: archease [Sedimentisphaerales bacterium]|nr:archease [Sedimentisphaerales bacterium]
MATQRGHWELFSHQADIGIRGVGESAARAFEQAGIALTAVIADPSVVAPSRVVPVSCANKEYELLFVDWLNALIYEMSTRQMLFSRFEVEIEDGILRANVWGERVDVEKHHPAVEVKAATYLDLAVKEDPRHWWVAQCVVDV